MGSDFEMRKETALRKNAGAVRRYVLGLSLFDVSAMTGITPSTVRSYERDVSPVSPFLSTAKRAADAYCVELPRLCSYDMFADAEEVANVQRKFLTRSRGFVTKEELDGALSAIGKSSYVTEHTVLPLAVRTQLLAIRRVCREGGLPKVFADDGIVTDFTYNFRYLADLCDVSMRRVSAVTGIGAATLARLRQGAEPTMSAVIRIADYFSVPVEKILSPGPDFDSPAEIIGATVLKKTLTDAADTVPEEILKRDEKRRATELNKKEAEKLLVRVLETG